MLGACSLFSKWQVSPNNCFVYETQGEVVEYLLAHACNSLNQPPPLFEPLALSARGNVLFIHDLAVSKKFSGTGIGSRLVKYLFGTANQEQYRKATLVAVQDSLEFWRRFGFEVGKSQVLSKSYSDNTVLMSKRIMASLSNATVGD